MQTPIPTPPSNTHPLRASYPTPTQKFPNFLTNTPTSPRLTRSHSSLNTSSPPLLSRSTSLFPSLEFSSPYELNLFLESSLNQLLEIPPDNETQFLSSLYTLSQKFDKSLIKLPPESFNQTSFSHLSSLHSLFLDDASPSYQNAARIALHSFQILLSNPSLSKTDTNNIIHHTLQIFNKHLIPKNFIENIHILLGFLDILSQKNIPIHSILHQENLLSLFESIINHSTQHDPTRPSSENFPQADTFWRRVMTALFNIASPNPEKHLPKFLSILTILNLHYAYGAVSRNSITYLHSLLKSFQHSPLPPSISISLLPFLQSIITRDDPCNHIFILNFLLKLTIPNEHSSIFNNLLKTYLHNLLSYLKTIQDLLQDNPTFADQAKILLNQIGITTPSNTSSYLNDSLPPLENTSQLKEISSLIKAIFSLHYSSN